MFEIIYFQEHLWLAFCVLVVFSDAFNAHSVLVLNGYQQTIPVSI